MEGAAFEGRVSYKGVNCGPCLDTWPIRDRWPLENDPLSQDSLFYGQYLH